MAIVLGKRGRWTLGVVAALTCAYALAGFLWAPAFVRHTLIEQLDKNLGVTPGVGEVKVNPFLLSVEIHDFSIPDAQAGSLLGFRRLYVEIGALRSLLHGSPVFSEIGIDDPYAHARISPAGVLNFSALHAKVPAPAPAAPPGPLPRLVVSQLRVTNGVASYEDDSRPTPFTAELKPIEFELRDFSTASESGRFKLAGESPDHERLEWQGSLALQPLASDGEFRVTSLQAVTIWKYLKDQLSLVVSSGTVDLDGHYDLALKDQPELRLKVENVAVRNLAIRPDAAGADWITLPTLTVRGSALDLRARTIAVDAVELDDAKVSLWLQPDGSINLARLAGGPAAGGAVAAPAKAPAAPAAPVAAAPWRALVREIRLNNATLAAEDRSAQPTVPLSVAPLNLVLTNASLDEGNPVHVDLDARLNGSGALKIAGSVTASPAAADLNVTLSAFPLASLQPFMARQTSVTVLDGSLGAAMHVQQKPGRHGPGTLAATGSASVDHLHTIDNTLRDDLVNWDRLTVSGLRVQHHPDLIAIDTITALKPYARAIVEPDRSLNIARALRPPGAAPPAETPPRVDATARKARPSVAAAPLPVTIRKVVVTNGQAQFTDLSIQPNFSTGIAALNGTVLGLSSAPDSRAQIDLKGQVDEYSPVTIAGVANFLGAKDYLDLDMAFRNMELTTFNPYSGKFAGYNITKGKLTTELKYKIDDRKLDARHHVTIDQLEFGARTDSKDAVSLPVKLAVALLKDRHGVIDLDIPITGTLDDPQFRLGPVIWKVVVNLLTKIVTSPFTLLGKLFGGGPDMQFVDFNAGSATLDAAAQQKIAAMTKALVERPQLQVELPIAVAPAADRPAIIDQRYTQELAQAGIAGQAPDAAAELKALTKLYARDVGAAPQFPPVPPPAAGAPAVDARAGQIRYLRQAIHDHITVGDDELKSLAQARAQALQQALLHDGQVDPARVFLVANDKVQLQDGTVRLELSLR
ncbi:MAG TPA: DUF748 domain-containing protein [Steroidobacteraceae bacterium]|nr:DUF748 domain-containing protein [Steroidobacteraceae bacterium]